MESLIRQARVRFSGVGQENKEETGDNRGQRIPPETTQSFKGEKKRTQNWFRRQFSRQNSQDYDSINGDEYPAAVAAAVFAINSLEELSITDQKKTTLTKIKSKTEDTRSRVSETGQISRQLSGKPSMTNSQVPDKGRMPEKAVGPAPSIKKTPTFADKHLDSTTSRKPESALPKPDLPSAKQPAFPPTDIKRQSSTRPAIVETEADAWEKAEMAKIKERYEKLNTKILEWENNKKAKAKHQMDKTESELESRRAKGLRHYRSKMESIDQIAGGAKAQAEENRRNEEFKVKEKANKIRSTGKIPATCLCF